MHSTNFSTLNLKPALFENLASLGYHEMTPIQAQTLPLVVSGKDVIGQGKTGSGKTAAFALGLLQRLDVKKFRIQSLVLCPTRELAEQVAKDIRTLARGIHNIKVLTLCGGTPMGPQIGSLEHGAHIIVGTPGRLEDHLFRGRLKLDDVNTLVLDEADRMLDMGFQAALDNIMEQCPVERQTLLFSATFPDKIQKIADSFMKQPALVKVASVHKENAITQAFYHLENSNARYDATKRLLLAKQAQSTVIFANTKVEVHELYQRLVEDGFSVLALHGDLEQRERNETLLRFANQSSLILVATDVAARGLDIDDLEMVINYHLTPDTEVHVHRIGRTGRAGAKGIACSLYTDRDTRKIADLETYFDIVIEPTQLPDESILATQPPKANMVTIQIDGGKKQKLRPGDIVGGLTGKQGIKGDQIGKIQVTDLKAYVAVQSNVAKTALKKIERDKLKGRTFRARLMTW